MREYGFSLTRTFPYNDRIVDSVINERIRVSENPHSGIFYAVNVSTETEWFNPLTPGVR